MIGGLRQAEPLYGGQIRHSDTGGAITRQIGNAGFLTQVKSPTGVKGTGSAHRTRQDLRQQNHGAVSETSVGERVIGCRESASPDPAQRQRQRIRSGDWMPGWGARGRTSNLRSQSPSLCQLSYAPGEAGARGGAKRRRQHSFELSAWSTADAYAPCANRPSCAPPHGRRGSGNRPGAAANAMPHHNRPAPGQCHDELRPPDRWCHPQ